MKSEDVLDLVEASFKKLGKTTHMTGHGESDYFYNATDIDNLLVCIRTELKQLEK